MEVSKKGYNNMFIYGLQKYFTFNLSFENNKFLATVDNNT